MLPLVIFLWFVGWSLFWAGSMTESVKPEKASDQNGLSFTVPIPEEKLVR
jgi:hypothetical protein